jgi:hypothetical protein
MPKENGAYARARVNYEKAGKDTAHRAKSVVCGTVVDGVPCPAMGLYLTTFRKDRLHFRGKCELGHLTERYGYANHEVVDS